MQHEMCLTESKGYFQRGLANLRLGYVGQAKQDFETALELGLEKADVYYHLALAKLHLDGDSNVIEDLTKAINLAPNESEYYAYRADQYHIFGNEKEAIADYEKYMELQIAKEEELSEIENHIWYDSGDVEYPHAFFPREIILKYLDKAVEKYPDNEYYWELLGDTYFNLGRRPEAVKCWEKHIALCIEQGLRFLPREEWEKCGITDEQLIAFCDQGLKKWPENVWYKKMKENLTSIPADTPQCTHSSSLISQDAAALPQREEAVRLNPSARNYYNRAKSYVGVLRSEKAIEDLKKVLELGKNTAFEYRAYEELAHIYESIGKYAEAIAVMERLLHKKYEDMQNHTEYAEWYSESSWIGQIADYDFSRLAGLYFKLGKTKQEVLDLFNGETFGHNLDMFLDKIPAEPSDTSSMQYDYKKISENVKKWLALFADK